MVVSWLNIRFYRTFIKTIIMKMTGKLCDLVEVTGSSLFITCMYNVRVYYALLLFHSVSITWNQMLSRNPTSEGRIGV